MISDFVKLGKDFGLDWNYVLVKDVTFSFGKISVPREFRNDWFWIREENGSLKVTIFEGYAWDGPTAVPDFDGTVIASVVHDAIYQFSEDVASCFGWSLYRTLSLADRLFKIAMEQNGVSPLVKYGYYFGVCIVGYPFHIIARFFR